MFRCKWYKGLLHRKIVSLILFSYFVMILLFLMNLDIIQLDGKSGQFTPGLLGDAPPANSDSLTSLKEAQNLLRLLQKLTLTKTSARQNSGNATAAAEGDRKYVELETRKITHTAPAPLRKPLLDLKHEKAGDFIVIGEEAFVYSAFIDDRKIPSFVRIISLLSKTASSQPMFCLFNETTDAQSQPAERYELCENHDKKYGGYVYSCRVPQFVDVRKLEFVTISFSKSNVVVALLSVRPPEHKIANLDLFPGRINAGDTIQLQNNYSSSIEQSSKNSSNNIVGQTPSQKSFTFAICISPLFGNMSAHRLVEFIELSRLLGAQYFIFYKHSLIPEISAVLQYYVSMNIASVHPWTLPPEIKSDSSSTFVWYYGQLLAHNDCLYRSMPRFDLVAFNDIDEFIVPHSSATSWMEIFPSLLADDRCGFSFQSAFYDPGNRDPFTRDLLTPILTEKTLIYSMVRTKVMLCPWRVFEVGIHHISKQNREEWRPHKVDPKVAYLHHYRSCLDDYGMSCNPLETDTAIADRYWKDLAINFNKTLRDISFFRKFGGLSD